MPKQSSLLTIIRRTHLLLALFLTPWIIMYALSSLAMHHRALFTGAHQRVDPGFELIREESYELPLSRQDDREHVARRILADFDLEGAFTARGKVEDGRITIFRDRPLRSYRVTYEADPGRIRVERQRFDMVYALEMLHRRRGFQHPFIANDLWAVIVDAVIVAILVWAATGLWMWWTMTRTRRLGGLFVGAGVLFFLFFMLML